MFSFDMASWLPAAQQQLFARLARRRTYRASQTIYTQGEAGEEMFRIIEGSVRLSVLGLDGREVTFLLFGPGDCFGVSSLVDGAPRPQTAEALTGVTIEAIDRAAFAELRQSGRAFDEALLRLLATQMRAVSIFYTEAQLASLRQRVLRRLDEAMNSFGTEGEGGMRLSLRLSHTELAAMVGSSRQSVGKILQQLQAEGLIRIEYGNILILDLAAFRDGIDDT